MAGQKAAIETIPYAYGNPEPQPGLRLDTIDGTEPDRLEGDVVMSALSFKSHGDVGFTIEQRLENAFCLTREHAAKAFAASRIERQAIFGRDRPRTSCCSPPSAPEQRTTGDLVHPDAG